MNHHIPLLSLAVSMTLAGAASAQIQGPSTAATPYVLPTVAGFETISLLTVDNTGATPDDLVPKVGGGTYGLDGIPDGLGAFDNGDGTFTLLMNHELGNTTGVVRDHGSKGSYVSKFVINKSNLAVVSGEDLMKGIYRWNATTQASDATPLTFAFARFCSGDLPAPTAFYNSSTGAGTTARIYLHGEENSASGFWQQATVVTGPEAGRSYTLGKFNLTTNGNTDGPGGVPLTGVGSWENALANPFPQDKTIVIGNNDGGTGIMTNSLAIYIGTKQATGSTEVEKAGLTNGLLKFILVTGNPDEVVNGTTRATNITNGTAFTLSATASTVFSRPEDGAWDPADPSKYYFVTTDRLDQVADGIGSQIGQTRLWRLNFTNIAQPELGGTIDLLIDGATVGGEKVNMFDNLGINAKTGKILLQEDVGGAAHNGKVWEYDPAVGISSLKKILRHDIARFGNVTAGVTTAATAPFNNDEEASGVIDISAIMENSALNKGYTGEAWYLSSDQAHYTSGVTTSQVEGGQLFAVHDTVSSNNVAVTRGGVIRDRRTGGYSQQITVKNNNTGTLNPPFYLVVDALSANATVSNATGTTTVNAPLGSPYLTISAASLPPGATATVTLQFSNPSNAAITYTTRVLSSIVTP